MNKLAKPVELDAAAELRSLVEAPDFDIFSLGQQHTEPAATPTRKGTGQSKTAALELGLDGVGLRHRQRVSRRIFSDDRKARRSAVELLQPLPKSGETLHMILPGSFVPLELVSALLKIIGQKAKSLRLATLGFSDANVETLCRMLDDGQVKGLSLICSRYFAAASKPIYKHAERELPKRGAQLLATRSHAKVMLIETGKTRWTFEGSGNLRSCVCIEQVALANDPKLFRFHAKWFDKVLRKEKTQ